MLWWKGSCSAKSDCQSFAINLCFSSSHGKLSFLLALCNIVISFCLNILQRYVKYFERTLTYFNGENQPGRRYGTLIVVSNNSLYVDCASYLTGFSLTSRCMLRGFRLHRCPYWIRPHITVSDHNGMMHMTGILDNHVLNVWSFLQQDPSNYRKCVITTCFNLG